MELERTQDLPKNLLHMLKRQPFLAFSDYQDDKRPFFWTELPHNIWAPHVDYFNLVSNIRDMIKDELNIKSSRPVL